MHRQFMPRTLSACIALTMFLPLQGLAQSGGLEEIVVTAQKRAQNVQDVPISVSAISGEAISNLGSRDFKDLLRTVSSLSYSSSEPGMARYSIRGVSTGSSSPTTGIYLDDVSLVSIATNFAGAIDPPLFDIDRIEVLKGPQGTLYGGSAMGGAIKYVSRRPDPSETTVDVAAGLSSTKSGDLSWDGETVLNLPLVEDRIAMRGGLMYRKDGGYVDYTPGLSGVFMNRSTTDAPGYTPLPFASGGTVSGNDVNERDNLAGKLAFLMTLDGDLTIVPFASFSRSRKDNPGEFWANLDELEASYRYEQPTDEDNELYSLTIDKGVGDLKFTSLTGYVDRTMKWERDYSYFVASLVPPALALDTYNKSYTETSTFSQEFRLASTDEGSQLRWTLGAYYADQSDELSQPVVTTGAGAFFGTGTDIVYVGTTTTDMEQYAVFGDITYAITPNLDASFGLRWFRIEQVVNGEYDGIFNGGASTVDDKKSVDKGRNPKFTLAYRPSDGHTVYGSATKGFRPGGPNRFNTSSPLCAPDFAQLGITQVPSTFGSDKLWTYEIGSKNELNDGRVILNAAAYFTDWKEIQQTVNLPSCGFNFVANVGAAEIKGGELELRVAVNDALTVGGNVSYTDSEITETALGVSAKEGQPMLDTPEWIGNAFLEYQFSLVEGWDSSFRASWEYHGDNIRQFDERVNVFGPSGAPFLVRDRTQVQEDYDVVNMSLGFSKDDWQLQLYVNNLGDADALLDYYSFLGTPNATTLRPRTIGASMRKRF